jgi:hypothetical protein
MADMANLQGRGIPTIGERFNLKNAVAAYLRHCTTLEMALPFQRIMRLATGPHRRLSSTFWALRPVGVDDFS